MIVLFNQLLDMPHLSGGWIILAKEKCSFNRDVNKFVHKIGEKEAFCAYGTFLGSFISAHETWDQHFKCCVFIFWFCVVYILVKGNGVPNSVLFMYV
jgi:hypothetical protein